MSGSVESDLARYEARVLADELAHEWGINLVRCAWCRDMTEARYMSARSWQSNLCRDCARTVIVCQTWDCNLSMYDTLDHATCPTCGYGPKD